MGNGTSHAIEIILSIAAMALIGFLAFRFINAQVDHGNRTIEQIETLNSQADEIQYTQYDQSIVSGSTVLNALRTNQPDGVVIIVDGVTYDASDAGYPDAVKAARTSGSGTYIAPTASYYGQITRNAQTHAIENVTFTIQ